MTPAIKPTIAWERGDVAVFQHSHCGSLVEVRASNAVSNKPARGLVGPCPWTGCPRPDAEWWEQRLPVGPFAGDDLGKQYLDGSGEFT